MSADRVLSAKVKSATQVKKPANARILTCLEGQVNVGKGQVTRISIADCKLQICWMRFG